MPIFTAQHENGTIWRMAAKHRNGVEATKKIASTQAMNYCRKNRIPGVVTMTNEDTGEVHAVRINEIYAMGGV